MFTILQVLCHLYTNRHNATCFNVLYMPSPLSAIAYIAVTGRCSDTLF